MKVRDILFNVQLLLFGDKKKLRFIKCLSDLEDENPEFEKVFQSHDPRGADYLETLYNLYEAGGDLKSKLEKDLEALRSEEK